MRYKQGDKVKIKSLDWFKANEYNGQGIYDDVLAFLKMTDECCGKELTIDFIFTDERGTSYIMKEPKVQWRFTDSMIEGLAVGIQEDKMVSLNKVEKYLRENIILYVYATDLGQREEWFNNFHKAMEE